MEATFIILLVIVGLFWFWKYHNQLSAGLSHQLASCTYLKVLGNRARVYSYTQITDSQVAALEEQFRTMDALAKSHGYTRYLDPTGYTVYVFPGILRDGSDLRQFRVDFDKNDPYDETIYDQLPNTVGGYMYVTEQVIDQKHGHMIIANDDNLENFKTALRNGMEHIILYHNDKKKYEQTKVHTAGQGHPLL